MLIYVLLMPAHSEKETKFANRIKNFNVDVNNIQNSSKIAHKTY